MTVTCSCTLGNMPGQQGERVLLHNTDGLATAFQDTVHELEQLRTDSRALLQELREVQEGIARERAALAQQVRQLVALWKAGLGQIDTHYAESLTRDEN